MSGELSRLESIKALHSIGKVVVQGMKPVNHLTQKDIDWLIEQAERAEKMEMMYENTGSIMNRRHQYEKIKRYELALEEITLVGYSEKFGGGWAYNGDNHAKCMNIAREALGNN